MSRIGCPHRRPGRHILQAGRHVRQRGTTGCTPLRSTGSAAVCPALFVGFVATMARSDFSRPVIVGYGSSSSRRGPARRKPSGQPRGLPVPTQGASAHARVSDHAGSAARAIARTDVSPSAGATASALRTCNLSRLNGWPMRSPADASPSSSRMPTHGAGSVRVATPSP